MEPWIAGILGVAGGSAVAGLATALVFSRKTAALRGEAEAARQRNELLDAQAQRHGEELAAARAEFVEMNRRRENAEKTIAKQDERIAALSEAEQRIKDTFARTSADALRTSSDQFLKLARQSFETLMKHASGDVEKRHQAIDQLVKPIHQLLEKQNTAVTELEKHRATAYKGLEAQITQIAQSHEKLNTQTDRLVTALRRPEQRGRWGEMQLRNVVELAGMTEHCDFTEQAQTDDATTRDRPDMIVRLPGDGLIVVDAKVALDAYLDALQPEADRDSQLRRHAEQVQKHYRRLAAKRYWNQFDRTPKLVVMFMPLESALVAALERKADLHADAMRSHVLIATPTLLVALLRAVAYGWQQEAVAVNARQIAAAGSELYDRLGKFINHFREVGDRIAKAGASYNKAVGSLESRVIPSTRKLRELEATTKDAIPSPPVVDTHARPISTGELSITETIAHVRGDHEHKSLLPNERGD